MSYLGTVDRFADTGKLVATMTAAALVAPAAGVAGNAAEAAVGGALRKPIGQLSGKAAEAAKAGVLPRVAQDFLTFVKEANPIEHLGDLLAHQVKVRELPALLESVAVEFAAEAREQLEMVWRERYFEPLETELEDLQYQLEAVARERRAANEDRGRRLRALANDRARLGELQAEDIASATA
jgi:hypothetical protein